MKALSIWTVVLTLGLICCALSNGCCSGRGGETFTAPELVPVGVEIPVPSPELECPALPRGALADLTGEQVGSDGALLVRACTGDYLALRELLQHYLNQCVASNEAKAVVEAAAEEARRKLEAMQPPE